MPRHTTLPVPSPVLSGAEEYGQLPYGQYWGLALLWSSMMVSTAFLLLFLWWVHSYRHAYHHGSFLVCRASVKSCTISFASQFNCFLQTLYSTIHPCKTPVKYRFVHLRPSLHQDLVPCNLLNTSPCYLQIL